MMSDAPQPAPAPASQPGAMEAAVTSPDDAVRGHVYGLLAGLLRETPDATLLARLAAIDAAGAAASGSLGPAWGGLAEAAGGARPDDLDDEFHALFIGVGRGELVPYGSWYVTGFMMDQPLAVLRADLRRLGFARQVAVPEPEDHVAALFEVMAMLVVDGVDTHTQRGFFERHLGAWITTFFKDLQKAKTARFYRAVGALGEAFVAFEREYLK